MSTTTVSKRAISRRAVVKFLTERKGRRFSLRLGATVMDCRQGYRGPAKGGELLYDFSDLDMFPVFDVRRNRYEHIDVQRIIQIMVADVWYNVL